MVKVVQVDMLLSRERWRWRNPIYTQVVFIRCLTESIFILSSHSPYILLLLFLSSSVVCATSLGAGRQMIWHVTRSVALI